MIRMYEARDKKDKYWYSLADLEKMYDDEPINYSYVHKRLECPCCGNEVLTCKIDEDFATITSKRNEHKPSCDYFGYKLNQNKVKQLLNNGYSFQDEYFGIIKGQPKVDKAIGRRSIERLLSEDDFMITKLFYGNVVIKSAHSKDETKYKNFSIKAAKGNAITLSFHSQVLKELANEIQFLEQHIDKTLFICFIGSIKQIEEYSNLIIDKPNQIFIKELHCT